MEGNVGKFYIFNGVLKQTGEEEPFEKDMAGSVYEVIRIIKGIPIFFEDHYIRMKDSLNYIGCSLSISQEDLKKEILRLIRENKTDICNVKVEVFMENLQQNYIIFINKSYYPTWEEVQKGVHVGLLKLERNNPNAKIINTGYKEITGRMIRENGLFEVLLVNETGRVTEGSKSNVFFIKDRKAYTAPGEFVLKGITRKYIFEACERAGIQVVESLVEADRLEDMEGLFISGTSIKVLPVASINGRGYKSAEHPAIVSIRDEFDKILEEYISANS